MSNTELRKRKVREHEKQHKPATNKTRKRKDVPTSSIQRSLLCLILSGSLLTLFIVFYTDEIPWHVGHRIVDHVAKKFGYHKPVHAVVIDAGSTGSRVLAYTFHEAYLDGHLVLDKELFEYNKPGLSSFAKEPKKGAEKIVELLEKAKKEIPKEYWSSTPLIMKATAGLRLLPAEQAENLLQAVRDKFDSAPFKTDENSVEIMDGTDEGIFSWFTVNFLLDKINGNPRNTVAALDLGGGSTQVTFSALTPSSLKQTEYIHSAISPSGPIKVFTHSYLGLGLKSARKEVLTFGQGDSLNLTSECVNHVVKDRKFVYHDKEYLVNGPQKDYPMKKISDNDFFLGDTVPIVNFTRCSDIVAAYVAQVTSKTRPPEELPTKHIFAFSYYYDKASAVGIIDFAVGGQVTVNDFRKQAELVCNEPNTEQPFICLDLTFIWLLLEKGFELSSDTKIYLYKKINGHEISWALGAAYNVLRE